MFKTWLQSIFRKRQPPAPHSGQPVVYFILTMDGVNRQLPGDLYYSLYSGFSSKTLQILKEGDTFSQSYAAYQKSAKQISHTISDTIGIDLLEDPLKWLCEKTGLSRRTLLDEMSQRLFFCRGTADYHAYGQKHTTQYSATYYFAGTISPPETAPAPVPGSPHGTASSCENSILTQGVEDLCRCFSSDASQDEIRAIGLRLYHADIPLKSGVGGMHQAYRLFNSKMPQYSSRLSQIWDGVGDWAD